MNALAEKFRLMHAEKYEAGQKEHGGNLWEKDLMDMIQAAKEEVIDQWAYLDVIERQAAKAGTRADDQKAEGFWEQELLALLEGLEVQEIPEFMENFKGRPEAFSAMGKVITSAAKQSADGWKPLETAPMDGTRVDLWESVTGQRFCNCYVKDGMWHWRCRPLDRAFLPTHWRPLPPPPNDKDMP